ncbi:MAG: hypothetical protein L0G96_14235 [Acinetobacter sp.]|nr:hypothetical protein [Acinetobacter sp.]
MKYINTTATAIRKIKSNAKIIKNEQSIPLSQALEISAKQAGYDDFHHATYCASKTQEDKKTISLGSLKLRFFNSEKTFRFDVDDEENLDTVTDELDEAVEEVGGGFGDMSLIDDTGLNQLTQVCKALVEREPAFLDGYAHWVGALVALSKHNEAISIGAPILDIALDLIQSAPKNFKLNYYELSNRPFYRLALNLVFALYGVNKNKEAKDLAQKMLKIWPNDNIGFRFLLVPPEE